MATIPSKAERAASLAKRRAAGTSTLGSTSELAARASAVSKAAPTSVASTPVAPAAPKPKPVTFEGAATTKFVERGGRRFEVPIVTPKSQITPSTARDITPVGVIPKAPIPRPTPTRTTPTPLLAGRATPTPTTPTPTAPAQAPTTPTGPQFSKGITLQEFNERFTGIAKSIFNKAISTGQDPAEVAPEFFGNQASELATLNEIRKAVELFRSIPKGEDLGLSGSALDLFNKSLRSGLPPERFLTPEQMASGQFSEALSQAQSAIGQTEANFVSIQERGAETFAEEPPAVEGEVLGDTGNFADFISGLETGDAPTDGLSPLQQAIIDSLQPSESELALQQELAGAQAAERQGVQDIEQQPIALPFITGQRAAVQKQAGIQQAGLVDQLALAQQARATTGGVATALAGFESQAQDRQQQDFQNRLALAGKGLRVDASGNFSIDPNLSAPDPSQSLQVEEGLRKEFVKDAGEFVKIRDSFGRIQAASVDPSAAGDLALIFNFMKMLDPGSVVRESEFATAQNAAGVPERIRASYNRVINGEKLGPDQRVDFVDRANKLFTAQNTQHQQRIEVFGQLATNAGVNPENVTINLGLASGLGAGAEVSGTERGEIETLKAQHPGKILVEDKDGNIVSLDNESDILPTDKRL